MNCASCRRPIRSAYLTALGQTYHPECFVCHHCRRPIESPSFAIHANQPYHPECLSAELDLHCAACGQPLTGQYTTALGQNWHPEHFVCHHCRRPFTGRRFVEKDGQPYCKPCYEELFVPHCSICDRPLTGQYVTNAWGDAYCQAHTHTLPECSSCGRPLCPSLTGGGVTYPDGRPMCNRCRKSAIDDHEMADPAFDRVRRFLARLGVDTRRTQLPLRLVDQPTLLASGPRIRRSPRQPTQIMGNTAKTVLTRPGQPIEQHVDYIAILSGLPWERFTAVAAHELGHAWLCFENITLPKPTTEEGFCELLAYLWLESLKSRTADIYMEMMRTNLHAVYRRGLESALRSYQRHTLPTLLAHLRATAAFP